MALFTAVSILNDLVIPCPCTCFLCICHLLIALHGRWKSLCYRQYISYSLADRRRATAALM